MLIAFITPELHSLVRRTNLASVSESLARSLHAARQDVRVFLPWTTDVETGPLGELRERAALTVPDGSRTQTVRILEGSLDGMPVYLLDNEPLFGSRHPYGTADGPYDDNWRRYAVFARAVLCALEPLGFQADILHCMDWTAGLVPLLHHFEWIEERPDHPTSRAGTYFGIHNLAMQGVFEREILPQIGVPHRAFRYIDGCELAGKVNYLKAGAEFATILGTHSPGHALKIQERDRGYGLEDTFQRRKKELIGIHHGIDYQAWDPANDPVLAAPFDRADASLSGKKKCKAALQAALKLDNGPRTPIACSIGRWDADSGFDLMVECLTEILERNVEVVVMGQGQDDITQRLRTLQESFLGRIRVVESYHPSTAHLIMGGSDILLLPAHYQPSNPLFAIAMRYGVVPLVYSNGGLDDSVLDYAADARKGTGFHFDPYTTDGLMEGVNRLIKVYRDASKWKTLQKRCLSQDFSWSATAKEYLKAYRRVQRRVKTRMAEA